MKYKPQEININDKSFPEKLKQIKDPPTKLYAIGDLGLLNTECITVVGSRKCSEYGIKMARKFSGELAMKGVTVVSGLAMRNRCNST